MSKENQPKGPQELFDIVMSATEESIFALEELSLMAQGNNQEVKELIIRIDQATQDKELVLPWPKKELPKKANNPKPQKRTMMPPEHPIY